MMRNLNLNATPDETDAVDDVTVVGSRFVVQEVVNYEPVNAPIDVEAIDDEVVILSEWSSRGGNRSTVAPAETIVIDDSDDHSDDEATRLTLNSIDWSAINPSTKGTIINSDDCENLGSQHELEKMRAGEVPMPKNEVSKEPTFSCSICWGPLVEETTTTCGHIFCQQCIKSAIKIQKKCPTCRKNLTMRSIHRIYLPASEN